MEVIFRDRAEKVRWARRSGINQSKGANIYTLSLRVKWIN